MTAAVVPALVCPLMPFRVAQLRSFLVQHRVEGFLDGLSNDSFQVVLEIFLVNWPAHPLEEFAKENIRYQFAEVRFGYSAIGC